MAKANSVYPVQEGVKDTYTRCKLRMRANGDNIAAEKVLTEGNLYKIYLYEGKYNVGKFNIQYAGNSPSLDAYVAYYYNGK